MTETIAVGCAICDERRNVPDPSKPFSFTCKCGRAIEYNPKDDWEAGQSDVAAVLYRYSAMIKDEIGIKDVIIIIGFGRDPLDLTRCARSECRPLLRAVIIWPTKSLT